ncbi:MAG: hypothetical protein AAF747_04870 [Planctomycetota bacterium]
MTPAASREAKVVGPELSPVQMHLHPPNSPGIGRVGESTICTAKRKAAGFVRHVAIDVSETALAGGFIAGQSFGVVPPGETPAGKPHKPRLYSIASPTRGEDGKGNVLATSCKRLIDEHWDNHTLFRGVASNYLCDLQVGDEVRVTGPNGKRFVLPARPEEHNYVFIATGTGIAPFRGMITDLLEAGVSSRIALLMGSPYASDLLYHDEMQGLADTHSNFEYVTAISRETQADGGPPMYVQERLSTHEDLLRPIIDSDRGLIYVCGIAGMEVGIVQRLGTSLSGDARDRYLTLADDAPADPAEWDRKAINRKVKPTKRMFLEVY